eukprot:SAG22_NODE_13483_length_405_cov_0.676471_1_plen_126_part_10
METLGRQKYRAVIEEGGAAGRGFLRSAAPTMMLSRSRPVAAQMAPAAKKEETELHWEEFVGRRDYTGALGILEFEAANGNGADSTTKQWIAYCSFHLGEHQKALDIYKELLQEGECDPTFFAYAAC